MSNFIEVTVIRDTQVLDGIIHGAYRRNRDAMKSVKEASKFNNTQEVESLKMMVNQNFFAYVDVTKKAAESAIFSALKRDDSGFITTGIHVCQNDFRGRSAQSPSIIFSDNLEVISDQDLSSALRSMFITLFRSGATFKKAFRFYCSGNFSEKFCRCLAEAYYNFKIDGVGHIHPYTGTKSMPIPAQDLHSLFIENRTPNKELDSAKYIVVGEDHAIYYSDQLIDRLIRYCTSRDIPLYIPEQRYRQFVIGTQIHFGVIA
ncbi:hypothetical protein JA13_225 [Dickeya phage vB_DsoM_JA13]|uniref:Uncharacterized protein n=1 Tax=Dickeya phage vB_DsoM_JA13 TaxID=2283030 RepID=A0A384ZWK3_9CAUD|nr:hypothetical protein JA13_225 [Dickeya phage vB_DsoM_JA13]